MKVRCFIWLMVLVVALLSVSVAGAADRELLDSKIRLATEHLKKPAVDKAVEKGFELLVEAIAMAAPDTGFPAEFGKGIDEARTLFASQTLLNEKGIGLLHKSYLIANAGKEFKMPGSISTIAQATERIGQLMDKARGALKQGRMGDCARLLLEAALMIVTPMEH